MPKIIPFFILFISVISFASFSNDAKVNKLTALIEEINLEPWESYQKLIQLEPTIESQSVENKLWFLVRKAQAENLLYFYSDFDITVSKASKLLSSETPVELFTRFKFYQGVVTQRKSQYKKAIVIFQDAMEVAKKEGLNHLYVEIKQEMAYTKSLYESFAISLADLQEAYIDAFSMQDDLLVGIINENYGAIYGFMGEYDRSTEYYKKAIAIYTRLGYRAHIAEATYGLAITYRYWQKYDLAISIFEKYSELINYTPNQDITFFAAYGLGMTLAEKGVCNQAITIIDHALTLQGDIDYNAELYKRKAQCLLSQNKLQEAQESLEMAKDIFASLPELTGTRWQLEVIKIEAEIAAEMGNIEKAYQFSTDYYQQYNQLVKTSFSEKLAGLRVSSELEQKNIEIAFLQQRSQVQKLEVEKERQRNKNQQYLILFVIFIVIVVLAIVLFQRRSHNKIYALSIKDSLSNLYNRRYIFELLTERLDKNISYQPQMSIILFDIDNFKAINDQYGHPFGDYVIKKIAEIGLSTLRSEDVMGRIGGEEFLCILSRLDTKQCLRIANRLLKNIEQYDFAFNGADGLINVTITVSIGTSHTDNIDTQSSDLVNSDALYSQADQALYHAKSIGKNSVVEYSEIAPK